ncbi:DUF4396 domain-containing protein [Ruegeria sp. 2205SS24-7]|uniref:DUF4396 domain-containing protein n=1 Tax=Ruegeria discodermiae TaxID=3064389 RepID=UPI002741CDA8|nr:DUF4396 domain-containing protein [Ruegeria sp. 2205SS24-7]MDP5217790.1 DUF4396 domain-containing protein [Ruegeria sp. 2205SS24-7]
MPAGAMLVWFLLTGASVAFVVWDSLFNGVTSWVQRAAWVLVTLYTGPVGLFFYLLTCRRPFPGGHDAFTKATWKQGVNSEMHCVAGDATGIIVAAILLHFLALPNGWDIVVEYSFGFISGLFVFQALMMLPMFGSYGQAVRKTIFAETASMNFVMTGMIPTMVLLAAAWPGSEDPLSPEFWFRMSLATVVGAVVAFPVKNWLVASHLKHGCMTLPGADGPAPGAGHRSPEMAGHEGMEMGGHMGHEMGHDHKMAMRSLPAGQALAWIIGTYALLLAALWLTGRLVPITF